MYFLHLAEVVSTHSHPKVAVVPVPPYALKTMFQHTATRRWLLSGGQCFGSVQVSTHSHPKVAATNKSAICLVHRFNTQPPEGGCWFTQAACKTRWFQHTATRRWLRGDLHCDQKHDVSTHSHPKVAEQDALVAARSRVVSTHSHPKVADDLRRDAGDTAAVSTHSHPKVAAQSH